MPLTDRMAHHEFAIEGKKGEYRLSVADVGDDYWNMPGPVAEAAYIAPGRADWDVFWRGPHKEARSVFILLKEALKAKIHPDRWITIKDGKLLYE